MNASAEQWLIREFRNLHKETNDPNARGIAEEAVKSSRDYLRNTAGLDESSVQLFESLYFPRGRNDRFIELNSICHLYFPLVEKKLHNAGLPGEYKYLPLVLSGYNQHARIAPDRTGMWAMDYLTARKWNLRVDTLVDERRGGDIAIDAAIRHLHYLRELFGDDRRSILKAWYVSIPFAKKQQTATQNLPEEQEAEMFVAFFDYTVHLFNQSIYTLPNRLTAYFDILGQYQPVPVKDTVLMEAFEKILQWNREDILNVNPVFTGEYLDPAYRRTSFMMDNRVIGKFEAHEAAVYAYRPELLKPLSPGPDEWVETEQKIYHLVRKGESLGIIAQKNNVSVSNIKKWNKLKSDKIRYGQKLIIYKKIKRKKPQPDPEIDNPAIDPTAVPESADATIVIDAVKPDSVKKPLPEKPSIQNPPAKPKEKTLYYKVKSGDTLWDIAKKYKVTPEQIMKWNNTGEKIRPGQKLRIITK